VNNIDKERAIRWQNDHKRRLIQWTNDGEKQTDIFVKDEFGRAITASVNYGHGGDTWHHARMTEEIAVLFANQLSNMRPPATEVVS